MGQFTDFFKNNMYFLCVNGIIIILKLFAYLFLMYKRGVVMIKDNFVNVYSLSKTIRMALIPWGKTENNFYKKFLLEEDEERAKNYIKVKGYMDEYHKSFIESALNSVVLNGVDEYCELYFKQNKSDSEVKKTEFLEASMRKQISKAMKEYTVDGVKIYHLLSKMEFIKELLPEFLTQDEEIETLAQFNDFSTYFQGFWENRKNIYTDKEKSTGVPYRCINDNLPKFLDNVKSFEKVIFALPQKDIDELNANFNGVYNVDVQDVFSVDYFNFVLSQSGIEKYNNIIGGYSNSDASKVQGLNEKINLYNQQIAKSDKSKKLPLLKPLYKQILSDRSSLSFIPEKFKDDNEVLNSINVLYENIAESLEKVNDLMSDIANYNIDNIFISSGVAVTDISKKVFGDWSLIRNNWNDQYESTHKKGKNEEKFYEKEDKEFKKIKSFSVSELQRLANSDLSIVDYLVDESASLYADVKTAYNNAKDLLSNEYSHSKRLSKNDDAIELIKSFLDSIKNYEAFLKPLCGTGKEESKDNAFYGAFLECFEEIRQVDAVYNKVRNHITQKPYSNDKIKLNFQNPQFLAGWDKNKERDYRSVLLRNGEKYYLAIMEKGKSKLFEDFPEDESSPFEKIDYKQISGTSRYFSTKQIAPQNPPKKILEYLQDTKSLTKEQLTELIKYTAEDFIPNYSCLQDEDGSCCFNFKFSEYSQYKSWKEFCDSLQPQAYCVKFRKISESYLEEMVDNGSLYMFQLYNKDFSENRKSKGTPNLHTLYFKMLFDERNLEDVVYKLSGGAEMFYRKPSINKEEMIVHPKNQPIDNKNPDNVKKTSTFEYDIVKDMRYTKPQFQLHLPIVLNFKANSKGYINDDVRNVLKNSEDTYVIGIDRGERNLVYACVVDGNGKLVEQVPLNVIEADNGYKTDYHKLLNDREEKRNEARKSWKTIGNIKELKEGYISQVVHKICQLVVKYDAVIAMEDLNSGFVNSRKKVEKQVYQKFERMLTQKLNYLVDKKLDPNEMGGLLNAYQLTNEATKVRNGRQDGIIFYIPDWLTSKIDPTTGFVNLLKPKYNSVSASKEFFSKFDEIRYNKKEDYFEFSFNYDNFPKCNADFKREWTVCSYGDRIRTFRDPENNNKFNSEVVVLNDEFKNLFAKFDIDYTDNLKEQILVMDEKSFYKKLMGLLSLTLQMRNSISKNVDVDYLISPVKNSNGEFYDSRNYDITSSLPCDADSNGAYNIARKGLWAINQIKQADDETKANISIKNSEWLQYAQNCDEL